MGMGTTDITRILKEGYEVSQLNNSFTQTIQTLNLDYLLLDTHPGIGEETLLSLVISDILLIIMRPDYQDYQGTSVTLDVCRRLEVPNPFLVVTKIFPMYDFDRVKKEIERTYSFEVAAILPQSDDLIELGSRDVLI
jgi:MinD-like ATPase involved in chromosome partitioning or flagellar assembly